MASPYTTPVAWVDETGLHVPSFDEVRTYFENSYRGIYGNDVYLGNDSQDGQWVGILATAVNDMNAAFAANYLSRSPSYAAEEALSSLVKINGLSRAVATRSTVDLLIGGQVGTVISNGIVQDENAVSWLLPDTVVIPSAGEITVTATARELGDATAPAGTVTQILTVTRGWQSVINLDAASPGQPVERDARLRARQRLSTTIPSINLLEGTVAAVAALTGVRSVRGYENDGNTVDTNGLPGHSVSLVVEGGDVDVIAETIRIKKGPGVGTHGDVVGTSYDAIGRVNSVRFFRPKQALIAYYVTLRPLRGYTADIEAQIKRALVDWTNVIPTGEDVSVTKAYVPANLGGLPQSQTYELITLTVTRDGEAPDVPADVDVAFNERPFASVDNVSVTVTS